MSLVSRNQKLWAKASVSKKDAQLNAFLLFTVSLLSWLWFVHYVIGHQKAYIFLLLALKAAERNLTLSLFLWHNITLEGLLSPSSSFFFFLNLSRGCYDDIRGTFSKNIFIQSSNIHFLQSSKVKLGWCLGLFEGVCKMWKSDKRRVTNLDLKVHFPNTSHNWLILTGTIIYNNTIFNSDNCMRYSYNSSSSGCNSKLMLNIFLILMRSSDPPTEYIYFTVWCSYFQCICKTHIHSVELAMRSSYKSQKIEFKKGISKVSTDSD